MEITSASLAAAEDPNISTPNWWNSRSLPACGGLLAWIRHTTGAAVTLSLAGAGEAQPFSLEESRTTQSLQKVSCTESAFRLDAAQAEGGCVLTLGMDLASLSVGRIYDYGVVLLP